MKDGVERSRNETVELRRYPNRRYYDRTHSQHLTLEEIYRLVCDGYEVKISDSKTGEDITAKILAHIIIEHDPPKLAAFPAELLHQIIRSNESLLRDFVEKYFCQALAAFLESQQEFDRFLAHAMGLYGVPSFGRAWMRMMMGPFFYGRGKAPHSADATEANVTEAKGAEAPTYPAAHGDLRQTVEELKERVASLRNELKQP